MHTSCSRRSTGGRVRRYLAVFGLTAVGLAAVLVAGAAPAGASNGDAATCVAAATSSISFPSSTVTAGVTSSITVTTNLPGACGGSQLHLTLHLRQGADNADELAPQINLNAVLGLNTQTLTMPIPASIDREGDANGVGSHPDHWDVELYAENVATSGGSSSRTIAVASMTVKDPTPLANGSTVNITGNDAGQRALLLQGLATPNATVNVAGNVNMDLTGVMSIFVAGGVKLIGDRTVYPAGPRLFTTTFGRWMFYISQDNVRISGMRLDGGEDASVSPYAGLSFDEDGIEIRGAQHVEIDHNELTHWHGATISVREIITDPTGEGPDSKLNKSNYDSVHIHDNYIHDNQHPTATGLTPNGHGAGYGVEITSGAYALIERNVFNNNRHAITAGGEFGNGYYAEDNLFLHPGIDRLTAGDPSYNHQIDVHGQNTCGKILGFGESYNCGPAGQYFDVRFNTVVDDDGSGPSTIASTTSTNSDAIQLRGVPTSAPALGMVVGGNVFAQNHEHALTQSVSGISDMGNKYSDKSFNDRSKSCDFDGDGIADSFRASGVTWWYKSSRLGYFVFLKDSNILSANVTLADYDGDHRCDMSAAGQITYNRDPILRTVTPGTLSAVVGTPVDLSLFASGGAPTYTWTVTGLPAGLTASPAGRITGTPIRTNVASYTVNATVRDANNQTQSFSFPGTLSISVPNVFSYDQASAVALLTGTYGLPTTTHTISDCWSPGDVENQSPAAGSAVAPGTTVRLTISTCPPPPIDGDGGTKHPA